MTVRREEDVDIKKELLKEVADALEKVYKILRQAYLVTINEYAHENTGVGSELVIDRVKENK